MTSAFTRIGLVLGATAIAVIVAGAGYQNLSAQGPGFGGPGRADFGGPGGPGGRRGGPGGPGGPGAPGGPGLMPLLQRLDLTSDQRDRVRQIMDAHRDDQKALGDRARKANDALQDAMLTFDESAVRARAAEVAAVDTDRAVAETRIASEVYQILTAEQQQKLKTLRTEMQERREKMRQEFEKNGPPDGGRRGGRGQR